MRYLIVLVCGLLLVGCSKDNSKKTTPDAKRTVTLDEILAERASVKLINNFSRELKGELLSAMNEGGPIQAIKICQKKAPIIASKHSNAPVWSICRVSDKNRNPDNLANEAEKVILARFADTTRTKSPFISEWKESDSGKTYYFYKPIRTGMLCLKCHGAYDKMDPTVKAILKDKYPNDRATGYQLGDLRGMFVVQLKWPEAKEFAQQIVADTVFRR